MSSSHFHPEVRQPLTNGLQTLKPRNLNLGDTFLPSPCLIVCHEEVSWIGLQIPIQSLAVYYTTKDSSIERVSTGNKLISRKILVTCSKTFYLEFLTLIEFFLIISTMSTSKSSRAPHSVVSWINCVAHNRRNI